MAPFYQSAFLEALGWSLVGSLWKMGGLWVGYILLTGNEKWLGAAKRYILANLMIIAGTVWSFSCTGEYYQAIIRGKEVSMISGYFKTGMNAFPFATSVLPVIAMVYMAMVPFLSGRLIYRYRSNNIFLSTNIKEANISIQQLFNDLIKRIGIRKKTSIWLSGSVGAPLTAGFLKPVILLPIAVLNQLSLEQTEAVIAHELFHIRRNDYLVNLLLSFSEATLFFNPFSGLFLRAIQKERELACDDAVMALGLDPWQYAHALFTLGKFHSSSYTFALAATGNGQLLLDRVQRLTKTRMGKKPQKGSHYLISATILKSVMSFFLCLGLSVLFNKPGKTIIQKTIASGVPQDFSGSKKPLPYQIPAAALAKKAPVPVSQEPVKKPEKIPGDGLVRVIKRPVSSIPLLPPAAPLPVNTMVNSFVSAHSDNEEYTLDLPETPIPPSGSDGVQTPLPYLPSSTFYYSNVEDSLSTSGKKIVHL